MKCPVCNVDLNMTDRQGVEIDYCPQCRGVWLDRGELDKLIERADQYYSGRSSRDSRDRDDYREHEHRKEHGHYKKKSFWSELFD
jgi:Zn-finger nucleic acid-binding protein